MLKIYDKKEDVPETDKEFFDKHYKQRTDGKWEPQIEGIQSLGGILNKNAELADKINKELNPRIRELESQETLPSGKIAVDKTEFDSMKTENDSYKALGSLDEIEPKVTGYDALSTKVKQSTKDAALKAAGINDLDTARGFKAYDSLDVESETKDGKEVFFQYSTNDKNERVKGNEFNAETLKSDAYKNDLGKLIGEGGVQFPQQRFNDGTKPNAAEKTITDRYAGTVAKLTNK